MSISGKIKFGFGVLLSFLAMQFFVQLGLDRATQLRVNAAITKNFVAADELAEVATIAQQLRRYEKEYFIYVNDPDGRAKYRKEWTNAYDKLKDNLGKMAADKEGLFSAKDTVAFSNWINALEFYALEFKSIMDKADAGSIIPAATVIEDISVSSKKSATPPPVAAPNIAQATRIANDMIAPGKDRFKEVLDGAQALRKEKAAESAQSVIEISTIFNYATIATFGVFFLGLIVAIYLIYSLPRSVISTIQKFVEIADKISKGDLKQTIQSEGVVEFESLSKALERLRVAQSGLIDRLRAKAS